MDRFAVIAGVNGNLAALEAVLAALDARCFPQIVCLGNLEVGSEPGPVAARLAERPVILLRGCRDAPRPGMCDILHHGPDIFCHGSVYNPITDTISVRGARPDLQHAERYLFSHHGEGDPRHGLIAEPGPGLPAFDTNSIDYGIEDYDGPGYWWDIKTVTRTRGQRAIVKVGPVDGGKFYRSGTAEYCTVEGDTVEWLTTTYDPKQDMRNEALAELMHASTYEALTKAVRIVGNESVYDSVPHLLALVELDEWRRRGFEPKTGLDDPRALVLTALGRLDAREAIPVAQQLLAVPELAASATFALRVFGVLSSVPEPRGPRYRDE